MWTHLMKSFHHLVLCSLVSQIIFLNHSQRRNTFPFVIININYNCLASIFSIFGVFPYIVLPITDGPKAIWHAYNVNSAFKIDFDICINILCPFSLGNVEHFKGSHTWL